MSATFNHHEHFLKKMSEIYADDFIIEGRNWSKKIYKNFSLEDDRITEVVEDQMKAIIEEDCYMTLREVIA